MKKILYLCTLMLLSMNMTAQIFDIENWEPVFEDEFTGNRTWILTTFKEQSTDPGFVQRWDCMMSEWWPYCVTTNSKSHQAYQPSNAYFSNNNKMKLIAEYKSGTPLLCANNDYIIPSGACCSCTINGVYYPPHPSIFYFSGTIETISSNCWFGYYEIKCQLPVHPGEGAAFWLFGSGPNTYEEIDVFEHSKNDSQATGNMNTDYSCGIWYNSEGKNYEPNEYNSGAQNYYKKYLSTTSSNDLTNEHTFGVEWLPNRITWYFDGNVVNECTNRDYIPQHSLKLKLTHPVKDDALSDNHPRIPIWTGIDEMTIDYVKYYQIRNNCSTDVLIQNVNDWNNSPVGLNRTITIGSSSGISVPSNTSKSFRASESITITNEGVFTIPLGAQVTFLTHDCVDMNNH